MSLVISCGYESNLIFPADVDGLIHEDYLVFFVSLEGGVGLVSSLCMTAITHTDAESGKVKLHVFIRGSLVSDSLC
jgi:hypothetical protein